MTPRLTRKQLRHVTKEQSVKLLSVSHVIQDQDAVKNPPSPPPTRHPEMFILCRHGNITQLFL